MIRSIKFSNFKSFYHEAEMSFVVNKHAPDTYHFAKCGSERISKIAALLGANGSGKSNVLNAIAFLRYFIARSFSNTDPGINRRHPHEAYKDQPSTFKVEFYIKGKLYRFCFKLDKERVLSESLEYRPEQRMRNLYLREYNSTTDSYTFKAADELKLKSDFINMVRPNASVISTAAQFNNAPLTQIKQYWTDIHFAPRPEGGAFLHFLFKKTDSYFYFNNPDYFENAKSYLRKLDLGLSDIRLDQVYPIKPNSQKKIIYRPYGVHESKGKKFEIPFTYESLGTQQLYTLFRFLLPALDKGWPCVVIDEIDASKHIDILLFILNLFISPEINPKGTQLFCTTHESIVLGELSKYQVFLTEKNKDCESEVYRLDEVEGVREDDNLVRKYLAGTYGGVPDI